MTDPADELFLKQAVELARENVLARRGRPFGAVLVRDGKVLATGVNEVLAGGDPSAHAELQAIRAATAALGDTRLDGAVIYASGQPCPMCLAAMYLTGVSRAAYASSNAEGEPYGLSTADIYEDLCRPPDQRRLRAEHAPITAEGEPPYEAWRRLQAGDGP
ncbi:nucleoside deaminase [Caulobacter sp. 17J80-11]|uniref:nucleoside deaminase n=1 Tax=Caulobacter sp. 17J80-11 TaxID=2763502 RepID=UPI0016539407|nr:nucleoside deaminase [Caulobacter sp. 17J80-11]MBC6980536.1 nucleoside deaminase [Caulobacter sp. 17J80-11]